MLDRDLAALYGVETRALNQAVKRNIERFPEDFMFQLTKGETEILKSQIVMIESVDNEKDENWKSQIVTSNSIKMGLRKMPFAFTELGVAMLSSVLKSPLAIQTNINIMRAFVSFRKVVSLVSKEDLIDVKKEIVGYIDEILADQNDINEGSITLRIETTDDVVNFTIEDTGPGIPSEKADFIFDKFTKVDMFTEGLGLGLFLCRRVVMLMNGTLTLDTQYTSGSRFVVSLPLHP